MSMVSEALVYMILQFLNEADFKESVHMLEKESGIYFNMLYFEDRVNNGDWDEVEKYLTAFTKVDDNRYSRKIFFDIRKQKYLEALDRGDTAKAVEVLVKDLKVFAASDEDVFKEIALLLTLKNFREKEQLSKYEAESARSIMLQELTKLINANPVFQNKLQFPIFDASKLKTLINQSLNWQQQICTNPKPSPDIGTLFVDRICRKPIGALAPSLVRNPLMGSNAEANDFPPLDTRGPFQPAPVPTTESLAEGIANPVTHQTVSVGHMGPADGSSGKERTIVEKFAGTNNGAVGKKLSITTIVALNEENQSLSNMKPRTNVVERPKIWKLTEVNESSQLRYLHLNKMGNVLPSKVIRLTYTNSGESILALTGNGLHKLWKWTINEPVSGKVLCIRATTTVSPELWQPWSRIFMINDRDDRIVDNLVPCFALSNNDCYLVSTSGGKISLFNMETFRIMTTFIPPPPAATYIAFHLQDNNIIAIGMEDSSIHIYNVQTEEVYAKLRGHRKQVTGLAFSDVLNVLVSSGSDAQICVWSMIGWQKQTNKPVQIPGARAPNPVAHTRVQFHEDQIHLLVIHETQLAIYEAPRLDCIEQWVPQEPSGLITDATFSCGSQSIYACFNDASVSIFNANLQLRCRINPNAYLPSNTSKVYPLAIAAHPSEQNQFALGLVDGAVYILEPSESEGQWGPDLILPVA